MENDTMFSERTQSKVAEAKTSARDALTSVRSAAESASDDIKIQVKKNADQAQEAVRGVSSSMHKYASENPWIVACIAGSVGLFMGRVVLGRR